MIRGALTLAIVPLAAACVMIATPGEAPTSATPLALVGGDGGPIAAAAELALIVPSDDTARIQECHITLIHAICDLVEAEIGAGAG